VFQNQINIISIFNNNKSAATSIKCDNSDQIQPLQLIIDEEKKLLLFFPNSPFLNEQNFRFFQFRIAYKQI
jgi:hypothetical protein